MKIGYLTAACMLPGGVGERADAYEHVLEMEQLVPACAEVGIELVNAVWDDPELRIGDFDAFAVGTTWDYQEQAEVFLARLGEIEAQRPLFNPLSIIRWNLDKGYLVDLAERGVATVPTLWVDQADTASIEESYDALGTDRVVVKPRVGAGAWRQALVRRGEPLPPAEELPRAEALIQPYLPSAETEGEYSFLFFGGKYSHCAQKLPQEGDYRVQSIYGGRERTHQPSPADLAVATSVIHALNEKLLYARVDLMRLPDGRLALMELELIEPYLYPEQGPKMGRNFAAALMQLHTWSDNR